MVSLQGLTLSGVLEDYQTMVGKIKGIDAIILGSASTTSGFAGLMYGGFREYVSNCTARMIDVDTGEVLLAANFSSEGASTMSGVTTATEIGEDLAKKLAAF